MLNVNGLFVGSPNIYVEHFFHIGHIVNRSI